MGEWMETAVNILMLFTTGTAVLFGRHLPDRIIQQIIDVLPAGARSLPAGKILHCGTAQKEQPVSQ